MVSATITCPFVGLSNPDMIFNSVDFPLPDFPNKITKSPFSIDKFKSIKTFVTSFFPDIYFFVTFTNSIA